MKTRLTFIHNGNDRFIRDLVVAFRSDYDVTVCRPKDENELRTALDNTDIAWFEWCESILAVAIKWPKKCRYICRLHCYEMFTEWPAIVEWHKVDTLIFVSQFVRDYCVGKFSIPNNIATVIHNGVDTDRFAIAEGKAYNKSVAYVGYINYKKGPTLLLQTFRAIYDYDPTFKFNIVGQHQDERIRIYMEHFLREAPFLVRFTPWTDDVSNYLADKDFIISTCLLEVCPSYTIMEGMSSGLIPLIFNPVEAGDLYPANHLFTYPNEAVDIICKFEARSEYEQAEYRAKMRQYAIDRFSLSQQIENIRTVLEAK